ncbi:MCE family protein [Nonomuraea sp. NPDC050310]|uniref:MCE family protein n=1 Tax=Nonomuraea sp. NPDC050310 TaxID=3154935 RepID=UPI0033CA5595
MFRRLNPRPLGLAALAVAAALVAAALGLGNWAGGSPYTAYFAESAGLRAGEPVLVAGVRVGSVRAVELDGARVRVDFRAEGVRLGSLTRAHIRPVTLLGAHALVLEPAGPGGLAAPIPIARTSVPYELMPAVGDLARTAAKIDPVALERAMRAVSQTLDGSSAEIAAALSGLSRLSRTVAERDDRLRELVRRGRTVTSLAAGRTDRLRDLARDGDLLLRELTHRRAVIHSLLTNTLALAEEVDGLIADNRAELAPALRDLRRLAALLRRNEADLDRSLKLLVPFTRQFTDVTGNGPWFDAIIQNLVPLPVALEPDATLGGLVR